MKIAREGENRFSISMKGATGRSGDSTVKCAEKSQKAKLFRSFFCYRRPLFLCTTSHEVAMCLLGTVPSLPWPWPWTHAQTRPVRYSLWDLTHGYREGVSLPFGFEPNPRAIFPTMRRAYPQKNQSSNMARNLGFWWHPLNPWIQPWLKQSLPLNPPGMWAKVFLFIMRV